MEPKLHTEEGGLSSFQLARMPALTLELHEELEVVLWSNANITATLKKIMVTNTSN